jgi:hypothetical protein
MNTNSVDPKEIDQLLSRELQSLSFQERSKIQEEVHGVTNLCPEESPQMVANAIISMQRHLEAIPKKPIYDSLSPSSYLHSTDWLLRFLRCELFDCKKAAERLVMFTEYMAEEYEMDVLERPLQLIDLLSKCGPRGKEVMDCFRTGHTQPLPFRDRSGRRVLTSFGDVAIAFDADVRVSFQSFTSLQ